MKMRTSTNKEVDGWRNIYAPKNLQVKVAEWLAENGLADDANNIEEWATFEHFMQEIEYIDKDGRYTLSEKYEDLAKNNYIDSFLRDVIYDAILSIT